jgi:peptidylprolyl isomerase
MAGSKRERQLRMRQAQRRAAAEARRRQARRRAALFGGGAVVLVAAIVLVVVLVRGGGKSATVATNGTSTTVGSSATTTPAAAASAAGKPCVPVSDPLPTGAPAVPVKVGPPPTQLVTQDLKVGSGATVTTTQTLTVNYIGVACSTGKIFDSSYSTGQPASFALSGVIKGWQDGIPGMKVGGQRLLGIPPADAYGATGSPPAIAPDETLWFVVEVIAAKA